MRAGLEPGQRRSESEALSDLTEAAAGFARDGIWALVAVLEHVARRWLTEFMEPGEQSVGARVAIARVWPPPAAEVITATATLRERRGRRYVFDVDLRNERGELIASGSNERAVIAVPIAP